MTAPAKWRVSGTENGWSVTAPGGDTSWTAAPSQTAAYGLAQSMAGIDVMLARINRPALTVVDDQPAARPRRRAYGFGPVTAKGKRAPR